MLSKYNFKEQTLRCWIVHLRAVFFEGESLCFVSLFVFVSIATEGALLLDLNVSSHREYYRIDSRFYATAKRCWSIEFKSFRAASPYANIPHLCLYTERPRFGKVNII